MCTGKEWHRFPNSFFLPAPAVQLAFVPSAFRGQLPAPFQRGRNGTWVLPPHMNDMNREEPSRYVRAAPAARTPLPLTLAHVRAGTWGGCAGGQAKRL